MDSVAYTIRLLQHNNVIVYHQEDILYMRTPKDDLLHKELTTNLKCLIHGHLLIWETTTLFQYISAKCNRCNLEFYKPLLHVSPSNSYEFAAILNQYKEKIGCEY